MKKYTLIFLVLALLVTGCNGLSTVSGIVTFEDESPLTTGTVVFQSPSFVTKSVLDSSGRYSVKIPPGEYAVYIPFANQKDETYVPPVDDPDAVRYIELIDPMFASAATSPLECSVTGSQTFDISVTKPTK